MTQDEIYPGDVDFDTPWGIEEFLKGEPVTRIVKPSQFIRLCHKITKEKQYRTIIYNVEDWPTNPVLIDAFSASAVARVWSAVKMRNKKKLVRMVRQGGPAYLIDQCFAAINAAQH